jgi:hypothetical protein
MNFLLIFILNALSVVSLPLSRKTQPPPKESIILYLSLPLLVLRVFANDHYFAISLDYLALFTDRLY